jgi:hypothetical protein
MACSPLPISSETSSSLSRRSLEVLGNREDLLEAELGKFLIVLKAHLKSQQVRFSYQDLFISQN